MTVFFKNITKLLLLTIIITISLIFPRISNAQQFFYQEEFDIDRVQNSLDPDKWLVYPNTDTGFTTIKESNGFVQLNQQNHTNKFPLAVSKQSVLPSGDFSVEVKFQYTNVTFWGTGFGFSSTPIVNQNTQNPALFSILNWQDASGPHMRVDYNGTTIHKIPVNVNNHLFKIDRIGKRYMLYLDNLLVFTSPETTEQIKYAWIGNPGTASSPIPQWTSIKIDYIRTKTNGPEAFLRLPWDYEFEGLTFNEASLGMSSYFDHEYPLLSTNLTDSMKMVTYENFSGTQFQYSSHDGYDYAKKSKAFIGKPVLAAASGTAKFIGNCLPCGKAILIDHHNGYQTRYYHLQDSEILPPLDGTAIEVTKGQKIGLIGYSGHVIPSGPNGAHLHFMVIQDKNNNGSFEDNIPDGITDPYGWQSMTPDPWENYSFSYNGQRTGNKSYYLWDKQLSNLDSTLTSNGGVFNTERFKLKFPQNFTQENLNLKMEAKPHIKTPDNYVSIGSTIKTTLTDFTGTLKEQFSTFYQMTIEHKPNDFVSIDPATLSIYSSRDGETWIKEDSIIDEVNNHVSAQLNHMTYFALMAKRKDTTPPTTTANIQGQKSTDSWYRSDVTIILVPQDNEDGLGVDHSFYRISGESWKLYESPITITSEGNYKIEFYSVDKDENTELPRFLEFSIDKSAPEAKIMVDPVTKDLKVTAQDTNNPQINISTTNDIRNYKISDSAGNTLTLIVQELDKTTKDKFSIKQLKYNDQSNISMQYNLFRYGFLTRNSASIIENQFFTMNNLKDSINILYLPSTNKSKIIIIKNGKITTKTETGLKLLQVTTNKGTLNYSY